MRGEANEGRSPLPAEEGQGEGRAPGETLELLLGAQRALRTRWEEFRRALERRDEEAYQVALADFHRQLRVWTAAEERVLPLALSRAPVPGRDARRELNVEWVQLRELTRYLLEQVGKRAAMADVLGLADNLGRRLAAHDSEIEKVYYPAVAPLLTSGELALLRDAAPPP